MERLPKMIVILSVNIIQLFQLVLRVCPEPHLDRVPRVFHRPVVWQQADQ
jgi:hypothetical protein